MSENWNFVLKVAAATFSALYGFYATVSDFRVTRDRHAKLSRKGYVGLTLLVIATLISLSADKFKEKLDEDASNKTSLKLIQLGAKADDASRKLDTATRDLARQVEQSGEISGQLDATQQVTEKNAKATSAVLNATLRALDPIESMDHMTAEIKIVPEQPIAEGYARRLDSLVAERETGDLVSHPGESNFPDAKLASEQSLSQLVNVEEVIARFRKAGDDTIGLTLTAQCVKRDPDDDNRLLKTLTYSWWLAMGRVRHSSLALQCTTTAIIDERTTRIRSYSDFAGASVEIELRGRNDGPAHPYSEAAGVQYKAASFFFTSPTGRHCLVNPQSYVPASSPEDFDLPYATYWFRQKLPYNCWLLSESKSAF